MSEQEQTWYFSFGHGQLHGPNGYVKIWGTFESARAEMFRRFGAKWCFQYPSAEAIGVEKFNLIEIK